ncbi:diacylglycerol/lipid kinase family protein [Streptomyces viridochromogenes]|uniref:diacylglycerol/lipid kinase family protein n=1 Tax=Streptomyces viridochromogenes TaxID=1938 RepID=UPI00069EC870|nr:diacylglycerol kinase family protein [Streptomyces viridochromogenes]KOG20747.1 diacylglycerol kinase [Streptomyces viridochromogenes]KOG21478.1 diacylglycerol kinase [Streptomyces viridochromogenes]
MGGTRKPVRTLGPADRPRAGAPRWAARLALLVAAGAIALLLAAAGGRSLALLVVGLAGLAATVAALWWTLARHGAARAVAATLTVLVPLAVLVSYAAVGLLWVVLSVLVLWAVAMLIGRAALAADLGPPSPRQYATPPPRAPFLVMNPRSGGGKVGRYDLVAKARALGAEVAVLDPAHPQDVAELARRAVARGADLLGVAGGDGTQAEVAGVAAGHGVPFMVICAGTRNHFAMDLGLDRDDPSTGLDALTDGVELRVDLGVIGERVFVNNASFGVYAAVVRSPAYRDGKVPTILRELPDLLTHRNGPRLTVRAGGAVIDAPQAVLVSNNPYHLGDAAGLGRRARLDSGVLGVLGINVDNAAQAAGLLRGRHGRGLTTLAGHEVVVDADAPEIPVGVDGEALLLPTPVKCRISPGVLRVRVPRDRPGAPGARTPVDWRTLGRLAFGRDVPSSGDDGREPQK